MSWTRDDDTLVSQVGLTLGSREEAVAHADRHGLHYRMETDDLALELLPRGRAWRPGDCDETCHEALEPTLGTVIWLSAGPAADRRCDLAKLPDLERALVSPAAVFGAPDEVLRHPLLSYDCRREILWRWAWDEYLKDVAAAEGMPEGAEPSRLDDVRAALLALGEGWQPGPCAPAARVVRYDQDPRLELAA